MAHQSETRRDRPDIGQEELGDLPRRDTIAAIATPAGRGGIGIVRLSGAGLRPIAQALTGRSLEPRVATYAEFRDVAGEPIDQGLALFFPAPGSYTGEDVLELHGHGGPVVLQLLVERCLELGARLALPGEFTHRAFINGKIDLVQAESVIDLIDASTAAGARGALRSLAGEFSRRLETLSRELIELRALTEAYLDFPEEDVDPWDADAARQRLTAVHEQLRAVLAGAREGSLLRNGVQLALAGAPNVGKSSLLNQLAGAERAIVTPIAGTTRDLVRDTIQIDGITVHVVDTAGLRKTDDPVEHLGVVRAQGAIAEADIVLRMSDESTPFTEVEVAPGAVYIDVVNKIDQSGLAPAVDRNNNRIVVYLSAKTGAGVDLLKDEIKRAVGWSGDAAGTFSARSRHVEALKFAGRALSAAAGHSAPELFAEELRIAQAGLNSITGEFTADDLLGEIFGRFCIGK